MIWFLEESNLLSGTLLSLSSYVDIECNSAESLANKYKLFETKLKRTINSLVSSKKYTMIEEFKDEQRGLKNILNEIKKTVAIERTRNKWSKKWNEKKIKYTGWWNNDILEKLDVNLTTLELRYIFCEKPHDFEKER